jgi:hypothetical protein
MSSYTATNFYNDELNRLKEKQANATTILSSNERISMLNDSYRKRYAKYVEILIVLVVAFALYLGASSIQAMVPAIPQIAVDATMAILIAVVLIYLINAFYELYTRNTMNYDELDLPAYDASGVDANLLARSGNINANGAATGNTCVGQACCPEKYTWDPTENKCKSGFTTLEFEPIQKAYVRVAFDSPSLQRRPMETNAEAVIDSTSLVFSKF